MRFNDEVKRMREVLTPRKRFTFCFDGPEGRKPSRLGTWSLASLIAFLIVALATPLLVRAGTDPGASTIQGVVVAGATANGNPLPSGLVDSLGKAQYLKGDSSGYLDVNVQTGTVSLASGSGVKLIDTGGTNVASIVANNGTAGNGVQVLAGRYDASLPTLTDGKLGTPELDINGRVLVGSINGALPAGTNSLGSITNVPVNASLADGTTNPSTSNIQSMSGMFNESTWDRQRNNSQVTAIASTVFNSATTTNGSDQINYNGRGLIIGFDITAFTAAGTSSTINVQAKFGSDYITVYSFTPTITSTGALAFEIYPGSVSPASWTGFQTGAVPRTYRVAVVTVGTVNYTATTYAQSIN